MVRALLVRGMLAGLAAGVVALAVSYLLGEPRVEAAVAFEESHAHGHGHGEELFSRTLQSTGGLATGVLLFGTAVGGVAALAFCFALGRTGRLAPRATAALVSLAALAGLYLVPFLKYPANPPSVGDPDTIGRRTALYVLMMLLGVLLASAAAVLGRALVPRFGAWYASVAAAGALLLAVGLAYALLPGVDEVPADFPATLLWRFRLAALAVQAALWTAFGLLFGELAERVLRPGPAPAAARTPPPLPAPSVR
ncbi:CbtA family protein [Streptomyces sp. NPDC001380]|uniref:CbtA family protein n=1 Tax=Streptomyces sp. NPDC001380 TaxID=3364566 RepID=UPI0036960B7D